MWICQRDKTGRYSPWRDFYKYRPYFNKKGFTEIKSGATGFYSAMDMAPDVMKKYFRESTAMDALELSRAAGRSGQRKYGLIAYQPGPTGARARKKLLRTLTGGTLYIVDLITEKNKCAISGTIEFPSALSSSIRPGSPSTSKQTPGLVGRKYPSVQ